MLYSMITSKISITLCIVKYSLTHFSKYIEMSVHALYLSETENQLNISYVIITRHIAISHRIMSIMNFWLDVI
ncbi:hypothetical protein NEPAR06_0149 [Nematocida parisii]|uniref:Uncharacterized protein n=1 Tax=Nematocida parisii (strain ERTm3) TaxID=935791 RepID=I3EDE9_NEMP3|nr:uncharacterized protein NEPG_00580 [Nematocida parisii ERTm1]EIJ87246.1 hypothetical protein NEQG_02581 [Nematocida parisii ERTm3]KAI5126572.1 hypothetical protein NEPAR08_0491 [Nematocida parisii]EIJ95055.1 hypothetical protein NEPG_00580 [Nematocida parisii ERTm1]KAI5127870.1 hypothetical protein NEPAR03_1150 [Nematocida parisii]KAI5143114.1 hypothetical protein NEPAR07_0476 [Nematocida parisii]|eukprot:XP_013058411.1 hypothetical protein NEPG_00580 [Nematocida parisii ERTm1]